MTGRADDVAGLGLAFGNLLAVIHHTIAVLHEILTAVLATADAVSLHDHIHELVVHQLGDVVDAHHRRKPDRAILEGVHFKVRSIGRRCCRFKFLRQLLHAIPEAVEAKCLKALNRTTLGIFLITDHHHVNDLRENSYSLRMRTPEGGIFLGCILPGVLVDLNAQISNQFFAGAHLRLHLTTDACQQLLNGRKGVSSFIIQIIIAVHPDALLHLPEFFFGIFNSGKEFCNRCIFQRLHKP